MFRHYGFMIKKNALHTQHFLCAYGAFHTLLYGNEMESVYKCSVYTTQSSLLIHTLMTGG